MAGRAGVQECASVPLQPSDAASCPPPILPMSCPPCPLPLSRPSRRRHRLHARARLARGGREVLPLQRRPGGDPDRRRVRVPAAGAIASRAPSVARHRAARMAEAAHRPLLGDRRPGARVDPAGARRGRRAAAAWSRSWLQARRVIGGRRRPVAGADGRQLPELGGAARRRLHGDDSRPLVSGHPVDAGVAPAVDRQGAHRVDGRADRRGGRGGVVRDRDVAAGLGPSFRRYITVGRAAFSSGSACCSASADRRCCRISPGKPRRSARRSRRPAFSTSISSPSSSARCSRSTCCSRRACPCSRLDGLRIAPRSGTCAISACEPRQGRKAAALSRS